MQVNELAWTASPHYLLAATGGDGVGSVDIISLLDSDLQNTSNTANTTSTNITATSTGNNTNTACSSGASNSSTSTATSELVVVDSVAAHVHNCVALKVRTVIVCVCSANTVCSACVYTIYYV